MRLRVKEVAKSKGFSMGRLKRESHLSYNTIRTLYKNPFRHVNSSTLEKIARALGVEVSELIESVEEQGNSSSEEVKM